MSNKKRDKDIEEVIREYAIAKARTKNDFVQLIFETFFSNYGLPYHEVDDDFINWDRRTMIAVVDDYAYYQMLGGKAHFYEFTEQMTKLILPVDLVSKRIQVGDVVWLPEEHVRDADTAMPRLNPKIVTAISFNTVGQYFFLEVAGSRRKLFSQEVYKKDKLWVQ
ncbi:MAG: hypothetical protein Q4P30_04180 [Eubacteriales bacterium]|nr:hypothetical protein [Eubacteriales bacterium]